MPAAEKDSDNLDKMVNTLALALAAVALLIVVAIPALIGFALYRFTRRHLTRRDHVIIAVFAALALLLTFSWSVGGYLSWLGSLRQSVTFPPVVRMLPIVALAFAVSGIVSQTSKAQALIDKVLHRQPSDGIIPTQAELKRLRTVPAPPSETISAQQHAPDSHEPGKRPFPIGVGKDGRTVTLGEQEIRTHMVILGATGSGKTETIKNVAGNLLDLGWSVILLDLKEDTAPGGLRDFCRDYAISHALAYQELALSNKQSPCWFNPLFGMTVDEAINTISSLQSFDDGYYQALNRTMIGQITTLFYDAHRADPDRFPPPDMYTIGKTLKSQSLPAATKAMVATVVSAMPGERSKDDFSSLISPSKPEADSASGLGNRITNMFESDAGRAALRASASKQVMDVTQAGICYVGLNTLGLSELARVVSTSVLMRVSAYAGARTTGAAAKDSKRIAVIIDEANWIDRKQVMNLLSRARSAGVAVVLCTQGPADWNDENGEDWPVITQNVNVSLIMRQGNEESAEMCADLIGKETRTSLLTQVRDGELTESGTMRSSLEYVCRPEDIRGLSIGQAILKVGVPDTRVVWVKVSQRDPRIAAK